MRSAIFRFDEKWDFPDASPEHVFDVLARGKLRRNGGRASISKPRSWSRAQLNFVLELVELERPKVVAVKVVGDFVGRWRAALSPKNSGTHVHGSGKVRIGGRAAWVLGLQLQNRSAG